MRELLAVVVLATLSAGTTVVAQPYVRQDCRTPTVMAHPAFDDETHALWYRRFWTGDCSSLSFCARGTPNWNTAVTEMLQKTPVAQRAAVQGKACRVGRLIGFEWARDNGIRKIDTSELMQFIGELERSNSVSATLDDVEQQAQRDLGR